MNESVVEDTVYPMLVGMPILAIIAYLSLYHPHATLHAVMGIFIGVMIGLISWLMGMAVLGIYADWRGDD